MYAANRGLRAATRALHLQQRTYLRAPRSLTAPAARAGLAAATPRPTPVPRLSFFSTTSAQQSSAPVMSQGSADYDPEIKDIADYVCNKPIESRLAVSRAGQRYAMYWRTAANRGVVLMRSLTRRDGFSSTLWAAASRACASRSAPSSSGPSCRAQSFPAALGCRGLPSSWIRSTGPSISVP